MLALWWTIASNSTSLNTFIVAPALLVGGLGAGMSSSRSSTQRRTTVRFRDWCRCARHRVLRLGRRRRTARLRLRCGPCRGHRRSRVRSDLPAREPSTQAHRTRGPEHSGPRTGHHFLSSQATLPPIRGQHDLLRATSLPCHGHRAFLPRGPPSQVGALVRIFWRQRPTNQGRLPNDPVSRPLASGQADVPQHHAATCKRRSAKQVVPHPEPDRTISAQLRPPLGDSSDTRRERVRACTMCK
jgi:hypothetical protein